MKGWGKSWKKAIHKLKIDKAAKGIDKAIHKKKKQKPLPKLEITGGPKHTDILIARTTEEDKRCIGGPEDSKRKIEWFRHVDDNVVLIKGVNGGFYQPSIDDVGCVIECQMSEQKLAEHARTSTHITLDDGIASLAVETLSKIQSKENVSFDANLVCDSVGSIPCQISLSGTNKNEVIFEISHTAKECKPEVKKEEEEDDEEDEVIVEAPISPFPKTAKFDDTIIEKMMRMSGQSSRSHVIKALYNANGSIQDAMKTLEKSSCESSNSSAVLSRANLMGKHQVTVKLDTHEQQGNRFSLFSESKSENLQWPIVLSVPWPRDRDILVLVLREIAGQPRNGTIENLSSRSIASSPLWQASRDDDDDDDNNDKMIQEQENNDKEVEMVSQKDDDDENKSKDNEKKIEEEKPKLKEKPTFDPKLYILKTTHERITKEKYEKTIKTLSRQLEESQSRVRALIQESNNMKEELSCIVKERDGFAVKMQYALSGKKALEFERTISKLREDLDSAETQNRALKLETLELEKSKNIENEESMRLLKIELQKESERSNEELRLQLKTLQEKLNVSETSRSEMKEKLKESTSSVTKLIGEKNAAKQKAVSMKSELRHLLSQKLKADNKVKELRVKVSEMQAASKNVSVVHVEKEEEEEEEEERQHVFTPQRSPTNRMTPSSSGSSSSWLSRHIMRKSDNQVTQLRNLVNALSDQLHDKETVLEEKRKAMRVLANRVKELEAKLRNK
eukprot:g964.t1